MLENHLRRSEPYKSKKWRWIKLKVNVITLLDELPSLKNFIKKIWRDLKWMLLRVKWKRAKIRMCSYNLDIDKTYWIDPGIIRYCTMKEFDIHTYKGKIIGGNWDYLEKEFDKLDIYTAFKSVFGDNKKWENTVFYKRIHNRIKKGKYSWGCKNKSELDERCKKIEYLYKSVRDNGYKSQFELSLNDKYDPIEIEDEITVCVGRFGDLLFSNSAHRLAIAKLMGIEKVPIKIAVRHPEWIKLRQELLLHARELGGKLYQPITHPDLDDIPAFHDCQDRFQLIKRNLSAKKGLLLDIGANFGYFCHRFENEGFECYAVENDNVNIYFLRKLRRAENRHFEIIQKSILDSQIIKQLNFNVVLALNIFHHFLKKKESYHKFINFLKNLRLKEMFFEPHLPDEAQMIGAYKNYSDEEFVKFILKNSNLTNATLIGQAKDGRKIYKIY